MSDEERSAESRPTRPLTVGVVAGMAGVSVRTLHHYDRIGLVTPSGRTAAGYRVYDDADVERLYRVLTYRELGFPLERIATLLDDPDADELHHLRTQRELLSGRIDHLRRMVAAVEEMMATKKQGIRLSAAEQAEIFGDDWRGEEFAAEAAERWGDTDAWRQSRARAARYTKEDWARIKVETDDLERRLADAMLRGVTPGSDEADALAEEHRAQIGRFYDCSHEMHIGLADLYVADPRFTAHYDQVAAGLAVYVREVIRANAAKQG